VDGPRGQSDQVPLRLQPSSLHHQANSGILACVSFTAPFFFVFSHPPSFIKLTQVSYHVIHSLLHFLLSSAIFIHCSIFCHLQPSSIHHQPRYFILCFIHCSIFCVFSLPPSIIKLTQVSYCVIHSLLHLFFIPILACSAGVNLKLMFSRCGLFFLHFSCCWEEETNTRNSMVYGLVEHYNNVFGLFE